MALQPGDKLGPYEMLSPIGKGGMGEVWKARDARLDRIVALKVSDAQFSERFEREAKAIAALNHPNICTLHDVGPNYLVMEYIEGTPLKGPLPVDQALKYAVQICDALDAAHKKGITHRDLKPANILVTKAGIKLLDFGLAKLGTGAGQAPKPDDATLTMALTGKHEIVGTLYYMSPEQLQSQANGQEIDGRSDIFSFGLVLYEMLTGKRAFEGSSPASVIAAIMERPAPSVVDVAPAALDRVLKRCLEKDPDNRWQSARDLGAALELVAGATTEAAAPSRSAAPLSSRLLPWAVAALLALGLGFAAYRLATQEAPRILKVSVLPPENMAPASYLPPAVSPDGKTIAFAGTSDGKTQIWVRDLDSVAARPLASTEGGSSPFWSPDSRWIGFYSGGKLKKTEVAGGPALSLCDVPTTFNGGSWGKDYIVMATDIGILRISPEGAEPKLVTALAPNQELTDTQPWFLPDGRHLLYSAVGTDYQHAIVYAADVESKDTKNNRRKVLAGAVGAAYAQGYILFQPGPTLMAQRFDTGSLETRGDAAPVAEHLDSVLALFGAYSVSRNGVLAYTSSGLADRQLTWYDRSGKAGGTVGTAGNGITAALSPDGSTIAFDRLDQQGGEDIWLLDLARGGESRLTFGAIHAFPVWSPDGGRVAYYSFRDGNGSVVVKARSGAGEEQTLDKAPGLRAPTDWSRDGRYIVEDVLDPKTRSDIWVIPVSGDLKPFVYLNSEFAEGSGKLSSNGQWLAYVSNETNRDEVYLQTFPKPGVKIQVSTGGGEAPLWSRDGKELYYVSADQKLMAVEVKMAVKTSGSDIQPGAAKVLFPVHLRLSSQGFNYDVAPTTSTKDVRFLIPALVGPASSVPITVVVNWTAALKK